MSTVLEATRSLRSKAGLQPLSARGGYERLCGYEGRRCSIPVIIVITSIGLIILVHADLMVAQLLYVLAIGQVGIRKAYRLDVKVDPKINAFLILEKARTGMTVAEIVETVFREYQRRRSGTIDDEGRRGRETGIVDPPSA